MITLTNFYRCFIFVSAMEVKSLLIALIFPVIAAGQALNAGIGLLLFLTFDYFDIFTEYVL